MTPDQADAILAELRTMNAQLGHIAGQLDRVEALGHEAHERIAGAVTDLGPALARFQSSKLAKLLGV